MSDQIQTKTLTNWYTFFRDVYIPYIAGVALVGACWVISIDILSFVLMIFAMAGMVLVIAERSWTRGRDDGVDYMLETLVNQGLLITETTSDDVLVKPAQDVVIYDRCTSCDNGWVYNPALTKAQGALSDE